jgi:hypothetical protein
MEFKKGQTVTLNDSGRMKSAVVVKDGIDTQGRVRVRPEGFWNVYNYVNNKLYVITN